MSIRPELRGVSETLIIPLYARAFESARSGGIIRDPKSEEIARLLDYDISKFGWFWAAQTGVAIRTEIIDRGARAFLAEHPRAVVVNLGAGLCTRFFRVDNGHVRWFELDVPEVKVIWEQCIGESERHRFLTGSVMDFSWMDIVRAEAAEGCLLIAEGLLIYFEEPEICRLLREIEQRLPAAEMYVEAISPFLARTSGIHPLLSKTSARFRWGIRSLKELERWSRRIRLLGEWYLFDYYPERWGILRWLRFVPPMRRQMKIGHLQIGSGCPDTRKAEGRQHESA